jgi:hypothetical protein
MWCSWLFFLICQLPYTTVLGWSQSGTSPSEFGSCINGYIWLCKCRPIWIPLHPTSLLENIHFHYTFLHSAWVSDAAGCCRIWVTARRLSEHI